MDPSLVRKSCFVIAPYEFHLGEFLEALRRERIEPFFISDFLKSGTLSISNVRAAFRSVDLIVALLVPGHSLNNVIFEVGIAVGAGRPLMLFSALGVDLPTDLSSLQMQRFDPLKLIDIVPVIKRRLEPKERADEFVSVGHSAVAPERPRPRLRGSALRQELQRIRNVWAHSPSAAAQEAEISRLFSEIGWTVVESRPDIRARAPDFALWIDEIQKDVGNPIAVEMKSSLSSAGLNQAVAQLSQYLSSAGAKAGIIIYSGQELNLPKNVAQSSPPIFAFSFDELANLVEAEKFPAALRSSSAAARRAS